MLFWLLVACGGGDVVPLPEPEPVVVVLPAALPEIVWRANTERLTSSAAVPSDEALLAARERLLGIVTDHARDPNNPWAIGHGLLALGPDAVLTNGVGAVDHLFAEYADELIVGGETLVRFPTSRGDVRMEPHADLVLKVLTEVGIGPDRAVIVNGQPHVVGDLFRGSLARAWVDGEQTGFAAWNDTPWALQGLASWAPPDLSWTATGGHSMTLDAFTSASVAKLRSETSFLREAIGSGQSVEKRGQHIFDYTCGGAHLFQGTAFAISRGYGTEADREAIREELGVYFWRAQLELSQLDLLLRTQSDYAPLLLEQRLKFTGHLLETAHKVWALGLVEPTEEELVFIAILRTQLVATVEAIDALGVWDRLADVRRSNEQVYLDYVGDAAHALRAIDLSTGAGVVLR